MAVNPIPQKNVVDAVFEEIMGHIVSGEWKIGEKIPSENELSAQLGVSRNSLRQALNRFNALGIIESRHGDGSYIRQVDLAFYLKTIFPMVILEHYDVLNVYQLQSAIQNEAAQTMCRMARPEKSMNCSPAWTGCAPVMRRRTKRGIWQRICVSTKFVWKRHVIRC